MQTTNTITEASNSLNVLEIAEEISQNLTIDVKSTSAYQRKLISVKDNRPSSAAVGWLGIFFISIPLSLMLLSDIAKIHCDLFRRNTLT